jgi:translocation and assembly module TamB
LTGEPTPPDAPPPAKAAPPRPPRRRWFKAHTPLNWLVELALLALLTAGALVLTVRIAPLTPEVRQMIEASVQGLEIGPYGKLRIEGLGGDVWRDFSIRRLTVADAQGVWIEADNLRVRWRYAELLRQRLHVRSLTADRLLVLRQPTPKKDNRPPGKPPAFSFVVDKIATRVELAPAFAAARGVYDANAAFDMEDHGAAKLRLDARSLIAAGDHLILDMNLGGENRLKLDADVKEAKGGALAGMIGLPADQPFDLTAHLDGTVANGRLRAVAHSGGLTPVQASGAWSPQGGGVNAHLLLGASKWTRALVGGFGPEAELAIVGKQAKGPLYDLDVRVITANIVMIAKGPFDTAKRSSPGLGLAVTVGDLHKLTSTPQMGAGKADGVLAGDLGDLRFTGDAEAHDLELWGWRLARAAGKVKVGWKKGELDVQGDVAGFGGSGAGVIAEAGGATPKATLEVMRLKDGRVLIKALDMVGRGARLQGTGGQNPLFQGLSFKGGLQITDLSQVVPGAGGGLDASWSANQESGFDKPWVFTAEGRGRGMTVGQQEIDRLLGPDARLTLAADFLGGGFDIAHAELAGAKAHAAVKGRWALAGDLNFDLDWAAEGPFALGPLEVDGKAAGGGRITGVFGAPRFELAADLPNLSLPDLTVKSARLDLVFAQGKGGSDGHVALSGQSDYGPTKILSTFRLSPDGVDLSGIDADAGGVRAKGAMALRNGSASSADLTVDVGPGALLSEGEAKGSIKIVDAAGGPRAAFDLSAKAAVLRGQPLALANARVRASGPMAKLPYQITVDGAWLRTPVKIDGSGVLTQDSKGYALAFNGTGTLRRAPFRTLEPATIKLDGADRSARIRMALGGGQASIEGRQTPSGVDLTANVTSMDLSFLSEDFTGALDADVTLQGQGADLHGAFDAALKNARSRDARKGLSINGQIKGALKDGRLTVDGRLGSQQGLMSSASLVLPAAASAAPFHLALLGDKPLQGAFQVDGEVQPLWDLFLGGERTVGGELTAKADLSGTLAEPRLIGRADLSDGLFEDYATGLKLRGVSMGAALNAESIVIDRFRGVDVGKGQVAGSGQINLAKGGGGNLALNLTGFRLIDNDSAQADATGQVAVTRGADGKVKLAGALEIVKAEVNAAARTGPNIVAMDVIEKNKPFNLDEQLAPAPATTQAAGNVALDVTLKAARGVLIKGRGLDVDMAIDARVTGTTAKPVLSGEARVVRGDYDFAGKRFEFDNRGVVRLSTDLTQVRLDLTATRDDPSLTAVIRIQGTAAKPQITLSSTPVLPNDEVLAQVLFGSSTAQLSPLEAAQLASALSALASGGGFDVVGGLRSFARLDRLALSGGTAATGFSVAGGKYLTDNVYVELAGGGRTGPSAQVEYRVTKNLSVVSKVNDQIVTQGGVVVQGGDELSFRWRRDFKDKPKAAVAPKPAPNPAPNPANSGP